MTLHPCDGVESEVFHAFRMLEEICRGRDEAALRKVAVLLPSSPTLIPFVQGAVSRFDQEKNPLPFNITLGYPLERTPMMQLIDSMLAVLENTDDDRIEADDYLQLDPPSLREDLRRKQRPRTVEKGHPPAGKHHQRART